MKKNLTFKELIFVASMLFGMFFGAGNLIFPIFMGQLAGHHVWAASAGFLITGVGLPLLGVAALGVSQKDGLLELSSQIGRKYGVFFTCLLYLTIGPFFAIPRCATVSFTVGIEPFISDGGKMAGLGIFCIFCRCIVFFIEAGTDLNVDRENTESSVFNFVEYFCYSGAFFTGRKYE